MDKNTDCYHKHINMTIESSIQTFNSIFDASVARDELMKLEVVLGTRIMDPVAEGVTAIEILYLRHSPN